MADLWLLCLVTVGAVTGSVLPPDRANSPCRPGTVWMAEDGCNTCFCLEHGMAECSSMECQGENRGNNFGGSSGESGMKPIPLPGMEAEWRSASGSPAGEMKPLPLPEPEEVEAKPYSTSRYAANEPERELKPLPEPMEERSGVNCTPGEEWQEDCNTCVCLGDGKAVCTLMGCFSEGRVLKEAVKDHCEANITWSDGCNTCHCIRSDLVICSYRGCPEDKNRHRRQTTCTPGASRQVDCNTCICLSDGMREGCSRKFCLTENSQQTAQGSDSRKAPGSGSECKTDCPADCASARGRDGCLTCLCDKGPFFGVLPEPGTGSAEAAAATWYSPSVDPVDPGFAVNPSWMLGGR